MTARRFRVEGDVQGVGFRAYAVRSAVLLGIAGEVWNTRDGAVEVYGQHVDANVLEAFADRLRRGPGQVDSVSAEPSEPRLVQGFAISSTR